MTQALRLSVLDQSTVVTGRSPDESIRESLALARHAEALGYARYWVSEHHNSGSVAGSAPEVLMAAIAATTQRIRVGSAGIMLPHYAALKVAEQFRVLEAIAPGRIDLGLGRAPGSDGLTAHALNPNAAAAAEQFPAQLRDLMAWVSGGPLLERHPFRDVVAQPRGPTTPQVWVLGSSDYGAQVAAHFGLPYCFAYFFSDGAGAAEALETYRAGFRPSATLAAPHAAICVTALAAADAATAARHYRPIALWRLGRDRGVFGPLLSAEQAAAYAATPMEQARVERAEARAIFGTGPQVVERLRTLAAALDVQEVAVVTAVHDAQVRRDSYRHIAEAAGLQHAALALAAE